MLADLRILMERRPAVPGRIAGQSVRVLHYSMGEWPRILSAIGAVTSSAPSRGLRLLWVAGFSAILLGLVALGSRWPQGADADHALLRLGWRLAGQVKERCRDLTPGELAKRPVHMRTPRECVSEVLTYDLKAVVDGKVVTTKRVKSPGLRADRPLSVEEDLEILPGEHRVTVTFTPADAGSGGRALSFERTLRFERRRVVLITYENDALIVK